MQKLLLIPFLLPLTGCAIIEIVDKATKISQTLKTTNQPIVVRCNNTNTKLINTYTIDPNKDEVIAEEWKSDQLDETKTTEIWELTERKTTSYIIENVSRIPNLFDKRLSDFSEASCFAFSTSFSLIVSDCSMMKMLF